MTFRTAPLTGLRVTATDGLRAVADEVGAVVRAAAWLALGLSLGAHQ